MIERQARVNLWHLKNKGVITSVGHGKYQLNPNAQVVLSSYGQAKKDKSGSESKGKRKKTKITKNGGKVIPEIMPPPEPKNSVDWLCETEKKLDNCINTLLGLRHEIDAIILELTTDVDNAINKSQNAMREVINRFDDQFGEKT